MSGQTSVETQTAAKPTITPAASGLLLRQCACGNHTVAGGECAECAKKKSDLQRKLTIGASNDSFEQEADRIADQVLTVPGRPAVNGAPPHVQRYAGQATEGSDTAPTSVDRVLAGAGRPLDPALRQDMEQRFGHDFSQVRVHSGAAAEQSAKDVSALAYTAGHDIVFGAGRYAPGTHEGRWLIAHELTHVVQQSSAGRNTVGQSEEKRGLLPIVEPHAGAVANRVGAGSVAGLAVQRKEVPDDEKTATPGPVTPDVKPGTPGAADATQAKGKTTNITFSADYHEVPGKGKDRVVARGTDDALWFDPLAVHSNVPVVSDTMISRGVVAGAGQQQIDTFAVPVTEDRSPVGIGSVTPALRYADSLNASFDVTVTLPKDAKGTKSATKVARTFLQNEIPLFGDIGVLETRTVDHLAEKGFPGATVKISPVRAKTSQVGQSTFFYRVHNNTAILMEILAQPAGEKKSDYSETKGGSHDVETEAERHGEGKVETVDVQYAKLVVETLNEYVKRVDDSRSELISNLSDKIIDDGKYTSNEKWANEIITRNTDDLDKKVKSHTETGEKDKKNWAARLLGPLGWLKKAISIPFIDKVPFLRRVKGWQLDLIEAGLDAFKEEGKVPYSDTTETTTEKRKTTGNQDVHGSDDIVIKSNSKHDQKRELVETVKSHSESEYKHFKERVESTREDYSKVTKMQSGGGSDREKENSSTTTSVTFSGSTTWKFTKPLVKATVVSGDGEVSDKPFTATPDKVGAP